MLFSKTRVLIKEIQMSSETGIQDVRVSVKEIQMSSETGIQDVRVLICLLYTSPSPRDPT